MKRSDKIEWFLRIATFGAALAVGVLEAWSVWSSSRNLAELLLFILMLTTIFTLLVYIARKRRLRMLQTRQRCGLGVLLGSGYAHTFACDENLSAIRGFDKLVVLPKGCFELEVTSGRFYVTRDFLLMLDSIIPVNARQSSKRGWLFLD
jgi:hypothetical protein